MNVIHQADTLAKVIQANTKVTNLQSDVFVFKASISGAASINLGGRSFGTNVMEAAMLAMLGKRWDEVSDADYRALLARLDFRPYVSDLVAHATT